jgi:hypothetical protein
MGTRWTKEDDARLTELWASTMSAKEYLEHMPGRTFSSIRKRASVIGLPAKGLPESQSLQKVRACLRDGKHRTAVEISKEAGVVEGNTRFALADLVTAEEIHIVSYDGPYRAAIYQFGPGVNAPKPEPLTLKERRIRDQEKRIKAQKPKTERDVERLKDDEYRDRKCEWWPKMNHDLEVAFVAMVRCGNPREYREAA